MKTIRLQERCGNLLMTREAITNLFASLPADNLILDFNGVEFISRSAAHEYFKQKSAFCAHVDEVNMSQEVRTMFILVAKQMKMVVR